MKSNRALAFGLSLSLSLLSSSALASAIELELSGTVPVELPANSVRSDIVLTLPNPLPPGVELLDIRWEGNEIGPDADVDLFVRWDTAIPTTTAAGLPLSWENLHEYAHSRSSNGFGAPSNREHLILGKYQRFPLKGGKLHITLANVGTKDATGTLSILPLSKIEGGLVYPFYQSSEDCGSGEWVASGEEAEKRRKAMEAALLILTETLKTPLHYGVRMCFTDKLPANVAVAVNETGFDESEAHVELDYTRFTAPVLNNTPYEGTPHAVRAEQRGSIDAPAPGIQVDRPSLGRAFGALVFNRNLLDQMAFETNPADVPADKIDMVTAVLHEVSHLFGVGYVRALPETGEAGFIPSTGSLVLPNGKGVLSRTWNENLGLVFDNAPTTVVPFMDATDEQRLASLNGDTILRFFGPYAVNHPRNALRNKDFPENLIRLHTPSTYQASLSYRHLDATAHPGELLNPTIDRPHRELGLAEGLLQDMGWAKDPITPPTFESPKDGQWFAPVNDLGKGMDLRKVAGTENTYFGVVYSFDFSGRPTWGTVLGDYVDGRLITAADQNADSIGFVRVVDGAVRVNDDPTVSMQFRMDFANTAKASACRLAYPNTSVRESKTLAGVNIAFSQPPVPAPNPIPEELAGTFSQLRSLPGCFEPLEVPTGGLTTDFSGVWFDPADTGWGITFVSFAGNGGDGLAGQLYYFDGKGFPRWGVFATERYVPGQAIAVMEVRGCNANCAGRELASIPIGTITPSLTKEGQRVAFNVTSSATPDARFIKDTAIVVGSERRY